MKFIQTSGLAICLLLFASFAFGQKQSSSLLQKPLERPILKAGGGSGGGGGFYPATIAAENLNDNVTGQFIQYSTGPNEIFNLDLYQEGDNTGPSVGISNAIYNYSSGGSAYSVSSYNINYSENDSEAYGGYFGNQVGVGVPLSVAILGTSQGAKKNVGVMGEAALDEGNFAGYFVGNVSMGGPTFYDPAVNTGNVCIGDTIFESDLVIRQSGGSGASQETAGITLINNVSVPGVDYRWRIYNSANFIRFNYSGDGGATYTAKSYIRATDGAYMTTSDSSTKTDVSAVSSVLPNLMKIGVKSYYYKDADKSEPKVVGVIAQELKEIYPSLVSQENEDALHGVNYSGMSVLAIKAIQEQQETIEKLENQNENLIERLEKLENLIAEMNK